MTWYVDTTSIRTAGPDSIAVWAKYVLDKPDPARRQLKTLVMHLNYPCDGPSVAIDSSISYDASGEVIDQSAKTVHIPAPPGTVYEEIAAPICKTVHPEKG
nr:surface-adhesin E family protein [Caballeronia hypogeia]